MKLILPALFAFVMLFSCTVRRYVYTPATANLLTPGQKGNAKVAVNYSSSSSSDILPSTNDKSEGVDLQAAYAITDKIALRAELYTKSEKNSGTATDFFGNDITEYQNNYRKNGFELSGGLYQIGKGEAGVSLQLFAGIGGGKFSLNERDITSANIYYHRMNYFKGFFQPSVRIAASKYVSITLGSRLSVINFNHIKTDIPDIDKEALGYIGTANSVFTDVFTHFEFGFKGLEPVKFQFQIGASKLNTRFAVPDYPYVNNERYDHNNLWLAAGIVADVNMLFGKK